MKIQKKYGNWINFKKGQSSYHTSEVKPQSVKKYGQIFLNIKIWEVPPQPKSKQKKWLLNFGASRTKLKTIFEEGKIEFNSKFQGLFWPLKACALITFLVMLGHNEAQSIFNRTDFN